MEQNKWIFTRLYVGSGHGVFAEAILEVDGGKVEGLACVRHLANSLVDVLLHLWVAAVVGQDLVALLVLHVEVPRPQMLVRVVRDFVEYPPGTENALKESTICK